jgi:hypothetical protein
MHYQEVLTPTQAIRAVDAEFVGTGFVDSDPEIPHGKYKALQLDDAFTVAALGTRRVAVDAWHAVQVDGPRNGQCDNRHPSETALTRIGA